MKLGKYAGKKFINVATVEALAYDARLVTIDHITEEKVGAGKKPVVYFQEYKEGLPLNATRVQQLIDICGVGDDTNEMRGKKLRLDINPDVSVGDRITGAVSLTAV